MSGPRIKYTELFSLAVEQLFYENGVCQKYTTDPVPDIPVVPTSECMAIMKRLNMVFKPVARQGGCIVFSHTNVNSGGDTMLRFPVKPGDKLSFWMLLKNPEVLNFNDLPVRNDTSKMYYFSNQSTDGAASRDDLHLSVDAAGVNASHDLIKKNSADYHFHHLTVVTAGTAFVRHLLTGSVIAPKSIVNQSGEADLYFDLSSLPSGKCKLIISGSDRDDFYYMGVSSPSAVFGVIEISLSPMPIINYRAIETGDVLIPARPFYKIQFKNRKTLWRYRIVLQKNSSLYIAMQAMTPVERTDFIDHLKIVTNDTAITFTRSSAGDTVFEFISDNVIPLQEKYISSSLADKGLCLTLKKNEGIAGEAVVRDYLPFPSGLIDGLHDPTIYSDIFLTI